MDKEILRIIIIAIGLLVIAGMLLWSYFKRERMRQAFYFDDQEELQGTVSDALKLHPEDDEFDIVPLGAALKDEALDDENAMEAPTDYEQDEDLTRPVQPTQPIKPVDAQKPSIRKPKYQMPALIQFSIVARADEGFNGIELVAALQRVGLEYGSLKIFERLDSNRLVDFGVASMVEPGTFPDSGLDEFYSPGLVFFMQPREVDDPLMVYEDFIGTIHELAEELDGVIWDHEKQELTVETIQAFREKLS